MIQSCPHCGRAVASDEWLVRTRSGVWVPTACAAGDGPLCLSGHEPVRNHSHWFVSCIVRGTHRLVAGPYPDYDAADAAVSRAKRRAEAIDSKCFWYLFGVASSTDPHTGRVPLGVV